MYRKDFELNVYHPFSGESIVHLFEDIRSRLIQIDGELLNQIQLPVIGQICKAQFEYDIRRFSEILTFPMIWYNRSFLGDENFPIQMSSTTTTNTATKPITPLIIKSNND